MKRTVILALLSLVSSVAFAQEKMEAEAIPPDVIDAFSMLYPKAKVVNWKLIGKDFEASFAQNERAMSVLFDQNGNLMIVKNKIDRTELPVPVTAKLKTEYPDWSVKKALRIDISGTSNYDLELEKDGETVNLTCSRQGDIIKILSKESFK